MQVVYTSAYGAEKLPHPAHRWKYLNKNVMWRRCHARSPHHLHFPVRSSRCSTQMVSCTFSICKKRCVAGHLTPVYCGLSAFTCASTTASAMILTICRTVLPNCSTYTGLRSPSKIGPTASALPTSCSRW